MSRYVKKLPSNQPVTAKDYNALLDLIQSERIACVGPGIAITRGAAGVSLTIDNALLRTRRSEELPANDKSNANVGWFFGKILAANIHGGLKSPQSVNPQDSEDHINVYKYNFIQVVRDGMTQPNFYPNGWKTFDGALQGLCYNTIEMNNPGFVSAIDTSTTPPTATGTYGAGLHGNGIDTTGSVSSTNMAIQPIPVGTVVIIYSTLVKTMQGNMTEYYCQYENGVDGSC